MSLYRLDQLAFEVRDQYYAVSMHYNAETDQMVAGAEDSNPRSRTDKFKYSLSKKTRRMAFEKRIERMKSLKVKESEQRIAAVDSSEIGLRSPELYIRIISYESAILRSFYSSPAYVAEKSKFDLGSPIEDFAKKVKKQFGTTARNLNKQLIIVFGESMVKDKFARKGHVILNSLIEKNIDVLVLNDAHTFKKCSMCHYTLKSCYLRAIDDDAKKREFSVMPKEGFEYIEQLRLCDSRQCKAYAAAQVDQNKKDRVSSGSPFHDLRIINVDVNCYVNRLVIWKNKYRPLFLCSNRRQRQKIKSFKKADSDTGLQTEKPLNCLLL